MPWATFYDLSSNTYFKVDTTFLPIDDIPDNNSKGIIKNKRKQEKYLERATRLLEVYNNYKNENWEPSFDSDDDEGYEEKKNENLQQILEKFNYYNNKLPIPKRLSLNTYD